MAAEIDLLGCRKLIDLMENFFKQQTHFIEYNAPSGGCRECLRLLRAGKTRSARRQQFPFAISHPPATVGRIRCLPHA